MFGFPRIILLAGALGFSGCATIQQAPSAVVAGLPGLAIFDRLYFGRNIPRGGEVSDDAWKQFLAEVVTPRFPAGFTVLRDEGQWREQTGAIVPERGFILEMNHADDAAGDRAVLEIAAEYKRRFAQEAVLRMRDHVDANLL